jgi:hypothetical protein
MAPAPASHRKHWLWAVLCGLLGTLLGLYLLVAHLSGKPFALDIFLYFCANVLGLYISLHLIRRTTKRHRENQPR